MFTVAAQQTRRQLMLLTGLLLEIETQSNLITVQSKQIETIWH